MLKACLLLATAAVAFSVPIHDKITPREGEACGYESCPQTSNDVLNVHIVAHTHDDVGWLKTVDQYYYGSNNTIQKAGVQYILDSVVRELWEDPKRRFIYVETAFFWKWWVKQTESTKDKVHTLVRQGRLQFVGGAWSMNDEAATHYQSTIDQFTLGLSKLNDTFGECGRPRVGWQIDPFGHSREFASLLAAMGYDGLFLGRIDYQDKSSRLHYKNMEMLWRGNDDIGEASDIFTGVLYNTYSPPPGFCFDILCDDDPIVDDPDSPLFNVDEKVDRFIEVCRKMSMAYRTNNILITMGDDFQYQEAGMWFKNLDILMEYSNLKAAKDGLQMKFMYSTPTCYLKAVKDANPVLPIKQDDFFPYASDPTAYWTGYFSSRPTTKYFEREANNYLQVVKQLQVLAGLDKHNVYVLNELRDAMGVMQHHDAITGTEKQHVAHDYERILNQAVDDALIISQQAFNKMRQGKSSKRPMFSYDRCHFNESSCRTAETSENFIVTVYNSLAWSVTKFIEIPVVKADYEVYDAKGDKLPSHLAEIPDFLKHIPTRKSLATHIMYFLTELSPLSMTSFYVKKHVKSNKIKRNARDNEYYGNTNEYEKVSRDSSPVDIENLQEVKTENQKLSNIEHIIDDINKDHVNMINKDSKLLQDRVIIDELEKLVINEEEVRKSWERSKYDDIFSKMDKSELRMLSDEPNLREDFTMSYGYYPGCVGDNREPANRSSGAYIFRPNSTNPEPYKHEVKVQHFENGDIRRTVTNIGDDLSVIRTDYISLKISEIDWFVRIFVDDGIGKDVVLTYKTDILNNGQFYTDSNGRQMLKRILNKRPQWNVTLEEPVAGNYYPVVNEIYIENQNERFTVLTDRAEGGASLVEGEIQLMVHRRLLHDDAFGVGEALNETALGQPLVAVGKHIIIQTKGDDTAKDDITIEKTKLLLHNRPAVFVSDAKEIVLEDWLKMDNYRTFANKPLPDGLHLLTLEPRGDDLLLRIENYMGKGPHSTVSVDLKTIFNNIKLLSVKETMLAANQWAGGKKWRWKTENEFVKSFNDAYGKVDVAKAEENKEEVKDDGFVISMKAKQIRTFVISYELM